MDIPVLANQQKLTVISSVVILDAIKGTYERAMAYKDRGLERIKGIFAIGTS